MMSEPEKRMGEGEKGSKGEGESPLHTFTLTPLHFFASLALVALVSFWLYQRALGFAYFNDDPTGHFAWMEGQSILRFFAGSADYGYYRPIVFVLLRVSELLFGNETSPHNPGADHALLLLLHSVNTAMVWALARLLSGRASYAWTAALVFAFVPFNYEAVAYVASLTHPLVVFWTLSALLLYERGQPTIDQRRLLSPDHRPPTTFHWTLNTGHWTLAAALLAMTAGLLTHENGLFIFPALVGLDWVRRRASLRERARRLWPFALPPAMFTVLWIAIPKNSEQGLNGLGDIGRNIVPFLQTLVFPLLPLARFDSSDVWPLAMLAVGCVAIFGLLAWRAEQWRVWLYALGWVMLSSLPAILFLSPAYVYGSPRLSYLPSIGVAMLWAIPVLWGWQVESRRQTTDDRPQKSGRADLVTPATGRGIRAAVLVTFTAVYIAAIALPPMPFINCQLDFYDETSRFARAMAAAGAAAPVGREMVIVNAPFFFSSTAALPDGCPSPYPWTPVGGILIPPYAQPRDFVRFNGGPDHVVTGVTFAGYAPGWRTFGPEIDGEALRAHAAEDAPFVFDLLRGEFTDLAAAWQPDTGPQTDPLASFGSALALTAAELNQGKDQLTVRLKWRVIGDSQAPLAAFVHIYGDGELPLAQHDGPPGRGLVPQSLWRAGDGLTDELVIDLSALSPGNYDVVVGVYNTADGTRLTTTANGDPAAGDLFKVGSFNK